MLFWCKESEVRVTVGVADLRCKGKYAKSCTWHLHVGEFVCTFFRTYLIPYIEFLSLSKGKCPKDYSVHHPGIYWTT